MRDLGKGARVKREIKSSRDLRVARGVPEEWEMNFEDDDDDRALSGMTSRISE